ncbi:hypothetical protein [Pedobacter psychrophilus]|nr:hypothetical protein [Pedobacter psychrophilus]
MNTLKSFGKYTMSQTHFGWSVEKLRLEFKNRYLSYTTYGLKVGLEADVSHLSLFYKVDQDFIIPILNNPFKDIDSSNRSLRSIAFETRRAAKEFENLLSHEYPNKFIFKFNELFPKS